MKYLCKKLAQFKQWILSIVKHHYSEHITPEYLISWCMECGKRFDKPVKIIKGLIMDEALDIITQPECSSSSCAVNGFCECDPVNEDMEYAGIYLSVGK